MAGLQARFSKNLCKVCSSVFCWIFREDVGADAHIGPAECTPETRNPAANPMVPQRADVGIGPYGSKAGFLGIGPYGSPEEFPGRSCGRI